MSSRNAAPQKQKWWVQIKETYSFARQHVSLLGLKLLGIFAITYGVVYAIGIAFGYTISFAILGVPTAFLVTTWRFGKMAEKAAYASLEGQLGAAASILQSMRGNWSCTPGVGVDKQQNLVHRMVGRAGIVLVGEGVRPGPLLAEQRKAHQRIVPGVEVHEIVVAGDVESLQKLQKQIRKFKKKLRAGDVTELRRRLEAMPRNALPIPKGPLPQGRKIPRR